MCLNHSLILPISTSFITLLASDKKEYTGPLKLKYNSSLRQYSNSFIN